MTAEKLISTDKTRIRKANGTRRHLLGCEGSTHYDGPMSDDVVIPCSLPLDSDRFLRRQCPTCEREFKWYIAEEGEAAAEVPDGGYFCPYCAIQAPATAWFTQAQVAMQQGLIQSEVVGPAVEKFADDLKDIGRNSGGFLRVEGGNYRPPARPDSLTESGDMRRVDFGCHPDEPVKVLDDWDRGVHCLICGAVATA